MAVGSWPEAFAAKQVTVTGGTQYDRLGGRGPAVLLLHGFDDTGDMWVPLAEALVKIDTQTTAPASDRDFPPPAIMYVAKVHGAPQKPNNVTADGRSCFTLTIVS